MIMTAIVMRCIIQKLIELSKLGMWPFSCECIANKIKIKLLTITYMISTSKDGNNVNWTDAENKKSDEEKTSAKDENID